ncbi:n utilization substance protein B homolog [Clostridium sp. CAG:307]|nr:n utilization substance protein B homolog [Clostridium sp. CAG:307]
MVSRHKSREMAIQLLYNVDFMQITLDEAKASIENVSDDALSFAVHVLYDKVNIDKIIEESLENYHINRLNSVDLQIIRLAVYEMKSGEAKAVVINEALELTKEYTDTGDKKAVRFNNKLLDKIANKIYQN